MESLSLSSLCYFGCMACGMRDLGFLTRIVNPRYPQWKRGLFTTEPLGKYLFISLNMHFVVLGNLGNHEVKLRTEDDLAQIVMGICTYLAFRPTWGYLLSAFSLMF